MNRLKYLKPFSFLPALLMMCLIFSFSAQTGTESGNLSYRISYKIIEIGGNGILHKNMDEKTIGRLAGRIEFPVRKLAHMTEYFILCVLVSFPLFLYGMRGKWLFITALMISSGFAATDEFHQSFVDGRGPSVKDVGIDTIGVLAAGALIQLLSRLSEKRRKKKIS